MKRTVTNISICFAFVLLIVIATIISAQIRVSRIERNIKQMATLRDLARQNPPDEKAIDSLIAFVHSNDSVERTAAIAYLGQVGSNAVPAVGDLIKSLNGGNLYDAREAAASLGDIGHSAGAAVPSLMSAVKKYPETDIGWFAAKSLGYIVTSNDVEVVTLLQQAAQSSDGRMRHSALEGLQAMGIENNLINQP